MGGTSEEKNTLYIELVGGRSRDECFINVSGNGRTEGEHQHSLGVNYTRVPVEPMVHQCTPVVHQWRNTFPMCVAVGGGTLARSRWLARYSQVSVTDH